MPLNLIRVARDSQFAQHALQFRLIYATCRGAAKPRVRRGERARRHVQTLDECEGLTL